MIRARTVLIRLAMLVLAYALGAETILWRERIAVRRVEAAKWLDESETFSEFESLKDGLEAAASAALDDLRQRHLEVFIRQPSLKPEHIRQWTEDLQKLAEESSGTPQATRIYGELLHVYSAGECFSSWLDLYLRLTLETPNDRVVTDNLERAIQAGQRTGRGAELRQVWNYLIARPGCFAPRESIRRAQQRLEEVLPSLPQTDSNPHLSRREL